MKVIIDKEVKNDRLQTVKDTQNAGEAYKNHRSQFVKKFFNHVLLWLYETKIKREFFSKHVII